MVAPPPIEAPRPTSGLQHLALVLLTARVFVVRKRDVRADEHIVRNAKAIPELDAALDRHTIADDDVVFDEDVIADVAVGSDPCAGQDVCEGPDARFLTNTPAGVEFSEDIDVR
jgi:hypothetical protein